jgi:serine/threonine-protein kinase Chk2
LLFFWKPPSSPGSTTEPKKRRSERVRSQQKARDETVTPISNAKGAKSSADKDKSQRGKDKQVEDKADEATMSPPSRPEGQPAPRSSPPPAQESQTATQIATQVASQLGITQGDDEFDPTVWGYLDLITDPSGKSVKLNKDGAPPKDKSKVEKKSGAIGFLIGRHPECDLHIDNAVISNRHCIIYKVRLEFIHLKPSF